MYMHLVGNGIYNSRTIRKAVKYYFADFVPSSLKKKSVKGGREVPPKSVTYFFGPKSGVFEQKKHPVFQGIEFFIHNNG